MFALPLVPIQSCILTIIYTSFPRHKHPTKVHVWAGIKAGRMGICIFDGIMKKELFTDILDSTLLLFIREVYPDGHRYMMDNNPKHTSGHTQTWLVNNGVNWWKTPPESPDLNPNLWHESSRLFTTSAMSRTTPQANHNEEEGGDGSGGTQQRPERSFTLYAHGLQWGVQRLSKALVQSRDCTRLAAQPWEWFSQTQDS